MSIKCMEKVYTGDIVKTIHGSIGKIEKNGKKYTTIDTFYNYNVGRVGIVEIVDGSENCSIHFFDELREESVRWWKPWQLQLLYRIDDNIIKKCVEQAGIPKTVRIRKEKYDFKDSYFDEIKTVAKERLA